MSDDLLLLQGLRRYLDRPFFKEAEMCRFFQLKLLSTVEKWFKWNEIPRDQKIRVLRWLLMEEVLVELVVPGNKGREYGFNECQVSPETFCCLAFVKKYLADGSPIKKLAQNLGTSPTAIIDWVAAGQVPDRHQSDVLHFAKRMT